RRGNGNELLVRLREFRQRLSENFRIRRRRGRRGLPALDLVFAETVELVRLLERWRVSLALLREYMQQHRLFLSFQKLKCPDQQRNIMAVDWPVVTQAEFFENDTGHEQALYAFPRLGHEVRHRFSSDRADEMGCFLMQMRKRGAGRNAV